MNLYKKILKKLIKYNISISVAESCTGGMLSSQITSLSGISKIFNMGLITYSNRSKTKLLNIPNVHIKKYGAASNQIATLMVKNLKILSKSKLCICTTGIAGPSGGTKLKPVGLVYIGINYQNKISIFQKKYSGNRKNIQKKTVTFIFKKIESLI